MKKWLIVFFFPLSIFSSSSSQQALEEIASPADIRFNGSRPWDIQVHNEAFYDRVLKEPSLGLGESYMMGWWDCQDLDGCMYRILRSDSEKKFKPSWRAKWAYIKAHLFNRQSKSSSLQVINEHYDLGNDLFERMLDPLMTYSCGYWKNASTLAEAQENKYDLIARKLGIQPGMRVLDIGCGWGGFAKYISEKYGAQVVAITLSGEQADYAKQMCRDLPVEVRVQDYRDMNETFDRVVEIGMFEHVGIKNHRTFMEVAHRCLKEDGLVMLHTIGNNESHAGGDPWIDKYIFSGGELPSVAQIGRSIEGLFVMEDWHNLSTDYDRTLMAWHRHFNEHWPALQKKYSSTFYRMWNYYLLSCAASFRARRIQLWQVVLAKNGVLGGYTSIR